MKQVTITRCNGIEDTTRENWKELISALALAGYEIYADEDRIVFTLGQDDEVKDVN